MIDHQRAALEMYRAVITAVVATQRIPVHIQSAARQIAALGILVALDTAPADVESDADFLLFVIPLISAELRDWRARLAAPRSTPPDFENNVAEWWLDLPADDREVLQRGRPVTPHAAQLDDAAAYSRR